MEVEDDGSTLGIDEMGLPATMSEKQKEERAKFDPRYLHTKHVCGPLLCVTFTVPHFYPIVLLYLSRACLIKQICISTHCTRMLGQKISPL